jgi:heme-degrading monooxygenase HmoA
VSAALTVLVHHRAPAGDPDRLVAAFTEAMGTLQGTAGFLGARLLRRADDPLAVTLVLDWQSAATFRRWQRGPAHLEVPSPLRPYQDRSRPGGHYEVHEVYEVFEAHDVVTGEVVP